VKRSKAAWVLRAILILVVPGALWLWIAWCLLRAMRVQRGHQLLVGLVLLGAFQAAPAQPADLEAKSVLLVAHPELRDPAWRETVLIAAPLPNGGHVGLILNRPTQTRLGELFPDHASSAKVADPVHFGGPFSTDALIALVRSRESPGAGTFALGAGLYLAVDGSTIDRVIEQTPQAARYYVGLVLWRPGELRAELAKGLWSLREADAGTVFRQDMEGLWRELSSTARGLRA
jgi:putative transcriptional regulator